MASDSVTSAPPVIGASAAKPAKSKLVKETKSKKPVAPRKSRSPSSHPPFLVMISEAIVALKERTGSSQYAITKFIEEYHKQLPGNFRKLLLVQLRRLVASGKLVKVKNSFKLSPVSATVAKPKAPVKKKPVVSEKEKPKKKAGTMTGVKRKAATEEKPPAKKAKKTVTAALKKKKATPVKKPKSVKSPVKKPKSLKSPAKKPAKVAGKRAKK